MSERGGNSLKPVPHSLNWLQGVQNVVVMCIFLQKCKGRVYETPQPGISESSTSLGRSVLFGQDALKTEGLGPGVRGSLEHQPYMHVASD